jgi:DNA modification methylase
MHHKIICGNCLNKFKKIKSNSIHLIITDPPFNIRKNYGLYKDNRKFDEYLEWCQQWLLECKRVLKRNGSLYLFNYPENNAYLKTFLDKHMIFRRWLTWHYPTNTGHSKQNFTRTQHSILFYTKSDYHIFNRESVAEPYKNPTDKRVKKLIENGHKGRAPYDVFNFNIVKNVNKEKTKHPCQLPKELVKIFIKASSKPRQIVLDPFAGSFTVCAAAKELGRNSIGIEINPTYIRIGKKRLAQTKFKGE